MKQILFLPLLGFLFTSAIAQTPETAIQKVQQQYNTEKIYFHYDKSAYVAGETIWFKAYMMDGYLPTAKSTVLGVELLNDSGRLVDKRLLPVMGSAAVGDFTLPKNLPSGNYRVKAYTRNLMNLGYEYFYYHQLNIYNPSNTKQAAERIPEKYVIDFFPEGGNLIGNVKNTIAFKCTDQFGRPVNVEGRITDGSGKEQLRFKTAHDGMGSFVLTAKAGERYMADCIIGGSVKQAKSLPPALATGVVLNVTQEGNKKFFTLDASTVASIELWPEYILGVQENTLVFKAPAGAKILKAEIPADKLITGILQLTVFNKQHQPLAERLVFINTGDYLPEGKFSANKVDLNSRAKNDFSFQLKDTIPGTFSVSVSSTETAVKQEDNIVSRFLLTPDIKGIVNNPSYYFENNDTERQLHLDLVMLTNGWRRYSWADILAGKFPTTRLKDPNFISIKAQAFSKISGKPLVETDLTMFTKTKDGRTSISMIQTDGEGYLDMAGMTFEDTANFSFQNHAAKNKTVKVQLLTPGIKQAMYSLNTPLPALFPGIAMSKETLSLPGEQFTKMKRFDGILLDEVKLTAKTKTAREKFEKERVTGRMGLMASKTLDLLTDPPKYSQRIFEWMRSNLTGVNISGGPTNYFINYRFSRSLTGGAIPMTIYVDEFEAEPFMVAMMNISEVALVKLYSNSAMTGPGGAIAIYTKRGAGISTIYDVPLQEFQIEGFSPTKEFFSPNYSDSTDLDILTDERTTLYWNPYLVSNPSNNSISFSFHNSDKAKKYKVVLQGMLQDGKLVHIEKIIE